MPFIKRMLIFVQYLLAVGKRLTKGKRLVLWVALLLDSRGGD